MRLLESIGHKRFFFFYHTYQVHHRYWLHEGFSEPEARECEYGRFGLPEPSKACHIAYEGEIAYMDHYIGDLFDFLRDRGLYDDMLIVFTSDHGEVFVEDSRGMTEHGYLLYDELIRVPLIVKFPKGRFRGTLVRDQVRIIDIVPTILDVLQIDGFEGDGTSLMPLIRGEGRGSLNAISEFYPFPKRYAYFPELNTPKLSFRRLDAKLIVDLGRWSVELYDLLSDPGERTNLLADREAGAYGAYTVALGLFSALLDELERSHARALGMAGSGERVEMTPELHDRLKALGYVQ
ncbi:MAG TPA: hypothetical protein ENF73_02420 [Proteobacteria bacterium]|nr:hypothetical protein [Pseudomonadota bacterium]